MRKFFDEVTNTLFVVENAAAREDNLSDNRLVPVMDECDSEEPPALRRATRGNGKYYFSHPEGKPAICLFGSFDRSHASNADLRQIDNTIYLQR